MTLTPTNPSSMNSAIESLRALLRVSKGLATTCLEEQDLTTVRNKKIKKLILTNP
jgi:hypothetical protein